MYIFPLVRLFKQTAAKSSRTSKTRTPKEHAPAVPFPLGPDTREDQGLPPNFPTRSKAGRGRGDGRGLGGTSAGNVAGNGPGNGLQVFGDGGDGQDMDSRVKVTDSLISKGCYDAITTDSITLSTIIVLCLVLVSWHFFCFCAYYWPTSKLGRRRHLLSAWSVIMKTGRAPRQTHSKPPHILVCFSLLFFVFVFG